MPPYFHTDILHDYCLKTTANEYTTGAPSTATSMCHLASVSSRRHAKVRPIIETHVQVNMSKAGFNMATETEVASTLNSIVLPYTLLTQDT